MIEGGLRPQLHCGGDLKKPLNIMIRNKKSVVVKPEGGLWTSTYTPNDEWCSDWVKWCANEMPSWLNDKCYILVPKKDARIYEIDSYEDLEWLYKNGYYRIVDGKKVLDFEKIARDFDAIHLTEKGQWETRLSSPYDLYGWDCESTIWFRDKFEKIMPLSEDEDRECVVTFEERDMKRLKIYDETRERG